MAEEKIEVVKKPYSKEKIGVTIMLVGLTAAIFLAIGYWAGRQTAMLEEDKTTTPPIIGTITSTATPKATTTTSATDETANWKTYTNEKYGFSFKYPGDWTYKTNAGTETLLTIGLFPPSKTEGYEYFGDITINVENSNGLTLEDFAKEKNYASATEIEWNSTAESEPINISGVSGIKYPQIAGMMPSTISIVKSGNYVYEIQDIKPSHQQDGIYDQILSTFEFTN